MRMHKMLSAGAAITFAVAIGAVPAGAQTVLNVATAGSQNMVDYITDYLGPMFEKQNPGVKVRAVGTGPGDAGSQKIFEKLSAQKKAGKANWDLDVAVVHQKMAGTMAKEGLLGKYRGDIATGKLVTRETARLALGTNVDGYVMPMFHSQTAIAYNPDMVKRPPANYDEVVAWVKANPKKFGYNGIKRGMSGVSFVTGWIYANTGQGAKLMNGPYDASLKKTWGDAWAKLKDFNKSVTFTAGNAGTLDMLNRGEIVMGPVWVDMFYSWQAQGRVPPNMKLKLIGPGMPGQPMYYIMPAKAANQDLAKKFIELATSPKVQAEGIVTNFSWYPGIDAKHVKDSLDPKAWAKLFADVTPEDLASKGKTFP
ncbi:MAG TPA: extracellular solute-binding protein, partial [Rhodospirillales bacterium]|nr:extracellular solute-binding protein [Rhodospirillales bacterium]